MDAGIVDIAIGDRVRRVVQKCHKVASDTLHIKDKPVSEKYGFYDVEIGDEHSKDAGEVLQRGMR